MSVRKRRRGSSRRKAGPGVKLIRLRDRMVKAEFAARHHQAAYEAALKKEPS